MAPTTAPLVIGRYHGLVPLLIKEEMRQLGAKEVALQITPSRESIVDERAVLVSAVRRVMPRLVSRYLWVDNPKKPDVNQVEDTLVRLLHGEMPAFIMLILYNDTDELFTIFDARFGETDKPVKSPRLDRALRMAGETFKGFTLPANFDALVKEMNTKLSTNTYYIHLTSRFIGAAYRIMEASGKVCSCMSHANAEYFKRDLPSCAYEDSLPLALALVSKYSLDDPRYVEDCPYVARVLARVDRDLNIIALGRIYCTNRAVTDTLKTKYVTEEKAPFIGIEVKGIRDSVPYLDLGLGFNKRDNRIYLNAWGEDGNTFGAVHASAPDEDDGDFDEYCDDINNWNDIEHHEFSCGYCGKAIAERQDHVKAVIERFGIRFETIAHQRCVNNAQGTENEKTNLTVQSPLEWPETVEAGSEAEREAERETEGQGSSQTNDPVGNYEAAA